MSGSHFLPGSVDIVMWITGATIVFGAGSFLGFNALGLSAFALPIALMTAVIGALAGLFLTILPIRKLDRNAKDELIPHLVAAYASGTYLQNPDRRMREYRGIGILPSGWTDEKNEDEITGCVDGIEFKMFETRLSQRSRTQTVKVRPQRELSSISTVFYVTSKQLSPSMDIR